MSLGERITRQITRDLPTRPLAVAAPPRLPAQEPSDLERAFNNFREMEAKCARLEAENADLKVRERSHLAEANMLREQYEQADADRLRLQAVASSLSGSLKAINAVIADAMASAIKNGVLAAQEAEAAKEPPPEDLEQAGQEVHNIIERLPEGDGTKLPPPAGFMR